MLKIRAPAQLLIEARNGAGVELVPCCCECVILLLTASTNMLLARALACCCEILTWGWQRSEFDPTATFTNAKPTWSA